MRSSPLIPAMAATTLTTVVVLALALQTLPTSALAQSADARSLESAAAPAETLSPDSTPSADAKSPPPLDEVIVTGEQPGPGLWKITHGGTNVVWVLGTVGGIPKGVKWRSR